jgi:hypothetical protein
VEPTEQARRWMGYLTGVLMRGETVARAEKKGGSLGGFSSLGGERKGEKKWGGPAVGVPRGMGAAWGLALTGGRRPDRVPADCGPAARHVCGALLFGQRHSGTDGQAPVAVRAERSTWDGPRRKRGG